MTRGRGRPKGAKDKKPRSPARLAANRANARRPRVQIPEEIKKTLAEAKAELAAALAGPGTKRIIKWLTEPENDNQFMYASSFAADRGGLPRRSELDVEANAAAPLLVRVNGGLGWPGVGNKDVGGGGDGAGSGDGDG